MSKESLVKNAADTKQVKKAGDKEKYGRDKEVEDLHSVFSMPSGRRVLYRILEQCQILGSADTVNHAEAHKILARQNIGKFLLSEVISADENYYFKMLVEHKQLEKEKLNV